MSDKVVVNGKVAVIISPGFGAGWYTWNGIKETLFDPELVSAIIDGDVEEAEAIAERKWPDAYVGGNLRQAEVVWLPEGTPFRVDEYDGSESLYTGDDLVLIA